jgi:hypothetical protein
VGSSSSHPNIPDHFCSQSLENPPPHPTLRAHCLLPPSTYLSHTSTAPPFFPSLCYISCCNSCFSSPDDDVNRRNHGRVIKTFMWKYKVQSYSTKMLSRFHKVSPETTNFKKRHIQLMSKLHIYYRNQPTTIRVNLQ